MEGEVKTKEILRQVRNEVAQRTVIRQISKAPLIMLALGLTMLFSGRSGNDVGAQAVGPSVTDPNLAVRTAVSGLVTPISMAFLHNNDFFILEKDTGRVKRVLNGNVTTVLDLGVNSNSERGLLGIALHPDFPSNPGVYLYWTCHSTTAPANPFFPTQVRCV